MCAANDRGPSMASYVEFQDGRNLQGAHQMLCDSEFRSLERYRKGLTLLESEGSANGPTRHDIHITLRLTIPTWDRSKTIRYNHTLPPDLL